MKKVTAIVLALLMVLSLAACGSAASESKTLVMATSADYPPYEFIILNDKNEQQLGAATYVVERVFTGTKTIQEVVTEELIFTGKQTASFDRQDSRMV